MIPFALLHALPTIPRHYEFPPRLGILRYV